MYPTQNIALLSLLASAVPCLATPLFRMVDTPLNAIKTVEFLNCVSATNETYKMMVDQTDGAMIVYPEEQRQTDYKTADHELYGCMAEYSDDMKLVLESSFAEEKRAGLDWHSITFEQLTTLGALGQTSQPIDGASDVAVVRRDTAQYYYNYQSVDDAECHSTDILERQLENCYTYGNPFMSVECENEDTALKLTYTIYPHHDCKAQKSKKTGKVDSRTVVVNPRTVSGCQAKTTYSYDAYYKDA